MPSIDTTKTMMTWIAPAMAIPVLRYTQDDREQRKTLFIRDLSTYTIGASLFLISETAFRKAFKRLAMPEKTAELAAFMLALTINILYAGLGAVQLSHWFNKHYRNLSAPQNKIEVGQSPLPFARNNSPTSPMVSLVQSGYTYQPGYGYMPINPNTRSYIA